MPKRKPDHWDELAKQLRSYASELTDERSIELYKKLYRAGWAKPEPMPLSTRNAFEHLKSLMMKAVGNELLEREGKKFDKMNRPGSSARRLFEAHVMRTPSHSTAR